MTIDRLRWILTFGALAAAFLVADAQAQTAAPTSGASPPITTITKYRVLIRRETDALADVTMIRSDAGLTIKAKSSQDVRGGGLSPQFYTSTTDSVLVLAPSLAPISYTNTRHIDGPGLFAAVRFTNETAVVYGSRTRTRSIALEKDTAKFVVLDESDLAALVVLPLQFKAWQVTRVTAISPFSRSGSSAYGLRFGESETPPKGVPASDLAFHIDGPDTITEWLDPITLLPDRIDLPAFQSTIVRAGIPY